MARDFSKVSPSLWQSSRFRNLASDDARYVYLYLLTSEHQNSAGAFRLPRGYAVVDLDWVEERFESAKEKLEKAGMIEHDPETSEYRICRWFKHNPSMNANHRKGIISILRRLESETLCENAVAELQAIENGEPGIGPEPKCIPGSYGGDLATSSQLNGGRK